MVTKQTKDNLLGTIKSKIVGLQYYDAGIAAGITVDFRRQRDNEYDDNAIGVFVDDNELAGYLPRHCVRWLAPLIDAGQLRLTGEVLDADDCDFEAPLDLSLHITSKGSDIFSLCALPETANAMLHKMVLGIYNDLEQCQSPEEIAKLHTLLKPLCKSAMSPQTRLLYELLPAKSHALQIHQIQQQQAKLLEQLRSLPLGENVHYRNLTIFPVLCDNKKTRPYILLDESLDNQAVELTEVDADGDVPTLTLINHSSKPVLIPEGQVVTGGKQNRVINITILVAAGVATTIPVSCVERSRWRDRGQRFRTACYAPPNLRARKSASVRQSRREKGTFESDQGQVWEDVKACLDAASVESETESLTESYEALESKTKEYLENLKLPENCCGALVMHGDKVVGMDLFDYPETFIKMWQRLGESYVLGVVNQPEQEACEENIARRFLVSVAEKLTPVVPAPGIGWRFEVDSEKIAGGSLVYQDSLCHVSAFYVSD